MNINTIHFLSINNNPKINQRSSIHSILQPLKKDTVSFSGSAKLLGENMADAPDSRICRTAYNNARPSTLYLDTIFKKYLAPINEDTQKDAPLITITTRTKTPGSIREKVISKFGKIERNEKEEFCEIALPEILNYYTPSKGITKENLLVQSKILLDASALCKNVPPFKNEQFFVEEIVNDLSGRNLINYNRTDISKDKAIEEISSKLAQLTQSEHCDKNGAYILPSSMEGVKHYANDIVGGRIILNDSSVKTVQKVFDALKKAYDDGAITITSIENTIADSKKIPKGTKQSDFEYLPKVRLKAFAEKTGAEYKEYKSKSGYMAIHVNVDFTNNKLLSKNKDFRGFSGEIQIMDSCIEDLKDVEDLCYKLKDEKNAFQAKYKPFKEYFRKYYRGQEVQDEFNKYTYDLYLKQRQKSLEHGKDDLFFPTLGDLGYEETIPEQLDYNLLKQKKLFCDYSANTDINNNKQDPHNFSLSLIMSKAGRELHKYLVDWGVIK